MSQVEIPFLPEFETAIVTGRKTATTRTKRYGSPGDCFEAFGRAFVITDVRRMLLGTVAHQYYLEEGFDSDVDFIQCWTRIHPRKGYEPRQLVYLHLFRSQANVFPFHVHELNEFGICRICGCMPKSFLDYVKGGR